MDKFASITAFVRVAETGGFTAAARRLNVSTTTVSEQVQALENELGVRLLHRTTRQVSLTEVGRDYLERCSQILHELEEADAAAGALQLTPRGLLRIYGHQGVNRFIAPVITGFLTRYPEVSIDLCTGDTMVDLVQERFDLAIMPASPPDSTLVRRRLAGWRHVLCCSPAYLENHPAPRSPADLAGHNCLLYTYSIFGSDWHFLDAGGNPVVVRVSGDLITTSIAVMREAAVAGLGLWMCPPYIVSDLLASEALVPLLPDYGRPEMEIVALYPHRRHMTAKVRAFIDMLVDRFATEQRWLEPM
ncbi:MAG: LysR family transcriptional regulator [Alphaproteobacteria bacterium]|nr:LysR family transcriptional regulator [Alphaproteobacteria bacterium]